MILPIRNYTTTLTTTLIAVVLAVFATTGVSRADPSRVYAPGGVALSGYDPVAYFVQGEPVMGRAEYALKWHGAKWYFATAEAMEAFEMNPKVMRRNMVAIAPTGQPTGP